MRPFGPVHLSIVAATLVLAIALARLCRQGRVPEQTVRYTLAAILGLEEITRYFYFGFQFPGGLPIHLCTLTAWMAVWGCLTLAPLAVEFSYFTGIIGAGMALLTPDLPKQVLTNWPSYPGIRYFVEHSAIILAVSVLVFGGITRLRPGAVWRTNVQLFVYAALLGVFNWKFGTNYMFLCRKPKNPSLLDWMGPWPYYLIAGELVCLGLFYLLWLPVRPRWVVGKRVATSGAEAAGVEATQMLPLK